MATDVTRRRALRALGATVGGLATVDTAAARGDDRERVNVGYSAPSGRRAARRRAREAYYHFPFDVLTLEVPEDATVGLRRRSDIRFVERDREMTAIGQQLPWGIDRIDADVAHGNGETGGDDEEDAADDPPGADIAIVDTGIDSDHPDLADNIGTGRSFLLGIESGNWEDDNGHGTHVAGTADALDNDQGVVGVSTAATLHAVKVLNSTGTGMTSDIARGLEWVADQGYDVANMSLGGDASDTLREAVEFAAENGVLLVAAAGNDGPCEDCVSHPAAYSECVAVSATSRDDSLASFSSTGPEVELAAPGEDITSTAIGGGTESLSGTSMAAPHVAGAGGQLMDDGLSRKEARDQLATTAEDIGLSGTESGNGLLDVAAALDLDSSDDGTGGDGTISDGSDTRL
jgi:subtilisin